MRLYIPTIGRAVQRTWHQLPAAWQAQTVLVSPHNRLLDAYPLLICGAEGISATRQWILEWHRLAFPNDPMFGMLDDDMAFSYRVTFAPPLKLQAATPAVVGTMLQTVQSVLESYDHVGLSARSSNTLVAEPSREIDRMNNCLFYNADAVWSVGARFDRLPLMEDFDMTLQLLRAGRKNAVLYDYCWDQRASNAPGGCSAYRTADLQATAARGLQALHPEFVRLVRKVAPPGAGWAGLKERLDVEIAWKKAFRQRAQTTLL